LRCFFALWPQPQIQSALEQWGGRWAEAARGRPSSGGSAHLTLAFLGELERDGAELARAREAAAACPFAAFSMTVECGGWFRAKRLGWLAPGSVPQALLDLADALRAVLTAREVRFDLQPFVPHITVLRRALRLEPAPSASPLVWTVDSFALMASVPRGGGRAYERIGEWRGQTPEPPP
jgi:2'-5' RNA ligase